MCFPVNFVKFLRAPFSQNTSGRLLLLINTFLNKTLNTIMRIKQRENKIKCIVSEKNLCQQNVTCFIKDNITFSPR